MRAAGFDTTTAVVPGAACDTIVDAASAWQPDLIVMGSRGRKGSGFVLGSVSDAVVHRAPCSVEIVRAPHRVSA
jgi:nucleotide-binding universal stress UspA family protein